MKNPLKSKYLENEITILKDVNHPNIIELIYVKETLENVFIITEYYNGGSLEDCFYKHKNENNKAFSEEIVQYIMRQLTEAMKYLHNKKILHRHIVLKNILINYEDENDKENKNIMKGKIKIIDFGFSRYLKKGELAKGTLGSPITMSPIIINKIKKVKGHEKAKYDDKEDIWSLGIACYELLVGEPPFNSQSIEELVQLLNIGDYYIPTTLSKQAMSFLNCMIQFNPQKRFDIEKLCNHEFLRKNVKGFTKLDINKLKNLVIVDNSKILINTKINSHIWDLLGD